MNQLLLKKLDYIIILLQQSQDQSMVEFADHISQVFMVIFTFLAGIFAFLTFKSTKEQIKVHQKQLKLQLFENHWNEFNRINAQEQRRDVNNSINQILNDNFFYIDLSKILTFTIQFSIIIITYPNICNANYLRILSYDANDLNLAIFDQNLINKLKKNKGNFIYNDNSTVDQRIIEDLIDNIVKINSWHIKNLKNKYNKGY